MTNNPISSGQTAKRPLSPTEHSPSKRIKVSPALAAAEPANATLVHSQATHQTSSSLRDSNDNTRTSNIQPLSTTAITTPAEIAEQAEHLTPLPEQVENRIIRSLDTESILQWNKSYESFSRKLNAFSQAVSPAVLLFSESIAFAKQIADNFAKTKALCTIASNLMKAGFPGRAKALWSLAKSIVCTGTFGYLGGAVLRGIAVAEVEAGDVESAKRTASTIEFADQRAETLAEIASMQAKAGNVVDAKQTVTMIDSDAFKSIALFHIVIAEVAVAEVKASDIASAKHTAGTIDDDDIQANALAHIASMQAKTGDVDAAMETVSAITDDFPKVEAFVDMAVALAKARFSDQAKAMFALAKATAIADLNDETVVSLIIGYIAVGEAKAGDIEAAKQTASTIEDVYQQADALNDIVAEQVRVGDFEAAKQTANTIGIAEQKVEALKHIVLEQANVGDFDGAKHTLDTMIAQHFDIAGARLAITIAQAKACDVDGAEQSLNLFEDAAEQAEACAGIALKLFKAGLFDQAKAMFVRAKTTASTINFNGVLGDESLIPLIIVEQAKAKAFSCIAIAQVNAEDVEGAKATAGMILDPTKKAEALSAVAIAMAEGAAEQIQKYRNQLLPAVA